MTDLRSSKIAVIGLGYVGLPLAVEFSTRYSVIGYDVNQKRIKELRSGLDSTREVSEADLTATENLKFSCLKNDLIDCNVYVVTVPTPIDNHKQPDLSLLIRASEMLGEVISNGDVIIYESTVYPGVTEEVCIPAIESVSSLIINEGFFVGYSPERINPGDKKHRIKNIVKVTSGSNANTADFVDDLYSSIISAGTYKASSIKVAEAAKVIENTQRDVNIALINELSLIFNKLGIDTLEVLKAAETKWNFLPFRPGLVGGHCIGVDPYYLTYKAESVGLKPEMILAGRRLNDSMGKYVVTQLVASMIKKRIPVKEAKVLIMGMTFKENCPDLRNTKVVDIITELSEYNIIVDVVDPWCSSEEALNEYNIQITTNYKVGFYDAIILAVGHDEFKQMGSSKIRKLGNKNHLLYDLKYVLEASESDMRL
jgi:UDP-N-acetyl-D-glucosamine/UDP-N-acetyl-D-galactosamine dehydrogenase